MNRRLATFSIILFSVALCGCATKIDPARAKIVAAKNDHQSLLERMAPVFRIHHYDELHNKIGTPSVRLDSDGDEEVFVSPDKPTVYSQSREFSTKNGTYMNLIYRVHFQKIPFSIIPFHLTAGKNVGIFVIVTVDDKERPVLVTTVHTCGCYMVSIPTKHLPKGAHPDDWPAERVTVYNESLPATLDYGSKKRPRLLVTIRPSVHRVMDLEVVELGTLTPDATAELAYVNELRRLRTGKYVTSFYHTDGWMKGYVKGSVKPWETLLMSILSFDLFVGTDKEYAAYKETENRFYTSSKVWRRKDSDMWDFAQFLNYWGWKL